MNYVWLDGFGAGFWTGAFLWSWAMYFAMRRDMKGDKRG